MNKFVAFIQMFHVQDIKDRIYEITPKQLEELL